MDVSGKVDRTFPVDGIPSGRIGRTKILHLQADAHDRFFRRQMHNPPGRLPGGAARRPANNADILKPAVCGFRLKLRRTEPVSIVAQTILPGKTASGGWGQGAFHLGFFAGSHHRDTLAAADLRQVVRQVGVL